MVMFPPVVLETLAPLLICRLLKFLAIAPLIEPGLPVKMIVDVPPSMVPAVVTRL